jgi:hypothetical protein
MVFQRIWLMIFASMCTTNVIAMDPRCQGRQGMIHLDATGRVLNIMHSAQSPLVAELLDCRSCDELLSTAERMRQLGVQLANVGRIMAAGGAEVKRKAVLARMAKLNCQEV